jgi:glycerol-3-phosphate acyltransferase PlsY
MINTALTFKPMLYFLIPAAFLLGSVPFGIIFTRNKGVDIRNTGSKNIGATNVLRSAGKKPALLTLLGDLLKGAIAVLICKLVLSNIDFTGYPGEFPLIVEDLWLGIVGLAAVAGHMFSVFLSFKGGKGVATGFGVLLVYSPAVAGITLLVWLSIAIIFRYSSLAALVAVGTMPVTFVLLNTSTVKIFFSILLAVLIVYRHKSNIRNLISGTESKI